MEMTEGVGKDHGKKDYRNSDKAGVRIAFPSFSANMEAAWA